MDLTVQVYKSIDELASRLAHLVVSAVEQKPGCTLGLPAGRTFIKLYRAIVADSQARQLDWSRVRTFNLDEFVTPDGKAPQPFQGFVHDQLLSHTGVAPTHADFPNGRAADLEAECDRYERAIASAGGLDLVLLGIGDNGHIGFNEPGPALTARTHIATLAAESRAANAWLFEGDPDLVPTHALSMGMATILGARSLVMVATGPRKAKAAAAMLRDSITTMLPASLLHLRHDVTVLLDEAAAQGSERFIK